MIIATFLIQRDITRTSFSACIKEDFTVSLGCSSDAMLMSLWTHHLSQCITADSWVLNTNSYADVKDVAKLIMIAMNPSLLSLLCKHVIHFRKVRKLLKSTIT